MRIIAIFSLLTIFPALEVSAAPDQSSVLSQNNQESDITSTPASLDNLRVTISGLQKEDVATVTLLPESDSNDSEPILKNTVIGNGNGDIFIDMSSPLSDGYYRLDIETQNKYFREPKAWLFMVSKSQLINPRNKSALFKLSLQKDQVFNTSLDSIINNVSSSDATEVPPPSGASSGMTEWMLSLSAPAKQPVEENSILSTGYHYFGWWSTLDTPGIWGRFSVVDPGVRHGATTEFVVDHIYARRFISGVQHWMEIGWAEVSWMSDYRYMFEYDSTYNDWRLWALPGQPLEVSLISSGNTWSAVYWSPPYNEWRTMASQDIGFSQADETFNKGEVYTDYGDHPSFPSATTDVSKLLLNSWVDWDSQRSATTTLMTTDTYDTHTTTNYYNFYIHSH